MSEENYEPFASLESVHHADDDYDMDDESQWLAWPSSSNNRSLADTMVETLESNTFSDISHQELPVSASSVFKTVAGSPVQLQADALTFAMISGNIKKRSTYWQLTTMTTILPRRCHYILRLLTWMNRKPAALSFSRFVLGLLPGSSTRGALQFWTS